MNNLAKSITNILVNYLGLQTGESVIILVDLQSAELGRLFFDQAAALNGEPVLISILPRLINGEEPPDTVAASFKKADIIIALTEKSLTHTEARREACAAGARFASMPGVTAKIIARSASADVGILKNRAEKLNRMLEGTKTIHLTSQGGTDLVFQIEGREWYKNTGIYRKRGEGGNLPAGEVYIAPLEGKTEGIIFIDGSIAGIGLLSKPVRVVVEKGLAIAIDGCREADLLKNMLDTVGEEGRNIAELGIGINDRAMVTGTIIEDEKTLGTSHVAFGSNSSFGGTVKVPLHIDGVILQPTLTVDSRKIINGGKTTF